MNPSARTKFLLIAPELARLAREAEEMAGYSPSSRISHHALSPAAELRETKQVISLCHTIKNFSNPFVGESTLLYNLATKAIMPDKVKNYLCGQSDIGTRLFEDFVNERIKLNKINMWAPMKKRSLQTWKSATKRIKLKVDQEVVELKEDRNLFARLLLVAKSRPNMNLEQAVGDHELSVVPRSLFSDDEQMLPCGGKTCLMSKLEGLVREYLNTR